MGLDMVEGSKKPESAPTQTVSFAEVYAAIKAVQTPAQAHDFNMEPSVYDDPTVHSHFQALPEGQRSRDRFANDPHLGYPIPGINFPDHDPNRARLPIAGPLPETIPLARSYNDPARSLMTKLEVVVPVATASVVAPAIVTTVHHPRVHHAHAPVLQVILGTSGMPGQKSVAVAL